MTFRHVSSRIALLLALGCHEPREPTQTVRDHLSVGSFRVMTDSSLTVISGDGKGLVAVQVVPGLGRDSSAQIGFEEGSKIFDRLRDMPARSGEGVETGCREWPFGCSVRPRRSVR